MSKEIDESLAKAEKVRENIKKLHKSVLNRKKEVSIELSDAVIDNKKLVVESLKELESALDEQLEKIQVAKEKASKCVYLLLSARKIEEDLLANKAGDREIAKKHLAGLMKQARFAVKVMCDAANVAKNSLEIRASINRQLKSHEDNLIKNFAKENLKLANDKEALEKKQRADSIFIDISVRARQKDLEKKMAAKYILIDAIEENAAELAEIDFERMQFSSFLDDIDDIILSLYEKMDRINPPLELADIIAKVEKSLAATAFLDKRFENCKTRVEIVKNRDAWKVERKKWIGAIKELVEACTYVNGIDKEIVGQISQYLDNRITIEGKRSSYAARCTSLKSAIARDLRHILNVDALEYEENFDGTMVYRRDNYYDPIIFTTVLEDSIRDYVNPETEPDLATGARMSLFKRFSIYYAKKKPDRIKAVVADNVFGDPKTLAAGLFDAINFVLEENGLSKLDSKFPVMSLESLKAYMKKCGAAQDVIDKVEEIFTSIYHEGLEAKGVDGENFENPELSSGQIKSALLAEKQALDSESIGEFIEYLVKKIIPTVRDKLARNITLWITKKYLEIMDNSSPVHLKTLEVLYEYSDKGLIAAYNAYPHKEGQGKINVIILVMAEYEKKQHDTVRKSMNQIENNIIPGYAKEFVKSLQTLNNPILY